MDRASLPTRQVVATFLDFIVCCNWYSVFKGADIVPSVLGEVAWNGWDGITWFDVSTIVNSNDLDGVKTLAPKSSDTPYSGCESYVDGCDNAYYAADDVQTKSTTENALVCTLGNPISIPKPTERRHAGHFITGPSAQQAHLSSLELLRGRALHLASLALHLPFCSLYEKAHKRFTLVKKESRLSIRIFFMSFVNHFGLAISCLIQ
jgi:hypothetical protein